MQSKKWYPVAFRPYVSEFAAGKGARCAVETVDRERYYFTCREDARRFMRVHGLEAVTDMTLERIRAQHPGAVVAGPMGSGSGTIVWDVYQDKAEVYPAVRAVFKGCDSGYPEDIGFTQQNLEVGKVYTIARVSIERFQTYVELVEKPGLRFRQMDFEYLLEK